MVYLKKMKIFPIFFIKGLISEIKSCYNQIMERVNVKIIDVFSSVSNASVEKNCKFQYDSLIFNVNSNTVFSCGGKKSKATEGDIAFIPAKTVYNKSTKNENTIVISFELDTKTADGVKVFTPPDRDYKSLFEKMLRIWRAKDQGYYYKTMVVFYGILGYLDTDEFSFGEESIADKIKFYIDDSFTLSNLEINGIASHFNLSEVYLRRVFKDKFGISPKEYLQNARLKYASFLLLNTSFTVNQIAQKAGYNDEKYFSATFKKAKGISPSAYKKGADKIDEVSFEE